MDQIEQVRREAEQDHQYARADAAERVKNQMQIADAAMKALLLANGGAMIALFTFIGNLVAKGASSAPFNAASLWWAFTCFVSGLVMGLICHLLAFLSQEQFYYHSMFEAWRQQKVALTGEPVERARREADAFRNGRLIFVVGIAAAVLSIALFAAGCGFALKGVLIR